MRYLSTRPTFNYAILLRVAFARMVDTVVTKRADDQRGFGPANLATVLVKTLCADVGMLLIGWLVGAFSIWTISTIAVPYHRAAALLPPGWFVLISCLLFPFIWLATDVIKALSYPQALPFAGLRTVLQKSYQQRFYWLLMTFCFVANLTLLCALATKMLLISKLFVSALLVVVFHAFNKRKFSHRLSLFMASVLFLSLLFANQAVVTARLTASFAESIANSLNLNN
ncbi:MAG: hypothetical protein AAF716_19750 [Cyanobacteria bacterium P01_D01_bin.1]